MVHHPRSFAAITRQLCSLCVIYTLLITLTGGYSVRRAEAARPSEVKAAVKPQEGHSASDQGEAKTQETAQTNTATTDTKAQEPASATTAANTKTQPKSKDRELIVRFRPDITEAIKAQILATLGAQKIKGLRGRSRLDKIRIPALANPETVAAALRALPGVEAAEPNYLLTKADLTPNDARFSEQWTLRNTGQNGGIYGADISAPAAWDTTTGSPATIIAVIDSGIDFTHPDLANNQWTNQDETPDNSADDDNDTYPDDVHGWDWITDTNVIVDQQGHGTAMAGLIAAEGNNTEGMSGVLWHASLMSLRVLDNTGTGTVADAVEAMDYAVAKGAKVINCSWGTDSNSQILKEAIERASSYGAVVVASAGNSARNLDEANNQSAPYYPSSYKLSNVISVASTDNQDQLATFSNWGAQSVTLGAPGVDLLTTKMGGGYEAVTGTSASAPTVSGVVGLIKTQRPYLSAPDTVTSVVAGVRASGNMNGKVSSAGIVNAYGALERMAGTDITPPPPPILHGPIVTATPPSTPGTTGQGFGNQDQMRNQPAPTPPPPQETIHSNLPCLDCGGGGDPGGGGGGVPGGDPNDPYFGKARIQPVNQTGQPGVTLGSRNFNWSAPLISLPGRAGHDLNIGLYYNSLVWTRQGNVIQFNADRSFPGPGFHLGMPILQPRFLNSQTGKYAYMMVTPAGGRVEMRQVGNTTTYESEDGAHVQAIDYTSNNPSNIQVRTMDGTYYYFVPSINSEFRCAGVWDRNGNVISAAYDANGHLTGLNDTMNRAIYFDYDANGNLIYIWQNWYVTGTAVRHNLVSFYYADLTVATNFPGLTLAGLRSGNGTQVPVLTQMVYADGSKYYFEYQTYGQIYRISHYGNDSATLLAKTTYNLPLDTSQAQSDCPRFTERREWTRLGVMNADAEVVYTYQTDGSTYSQVTAPDGTVQKEIYYTAPAWASGLLARSEVYEGTTLRKHTDYSWTADNTTVSYQVNPKIVETNVYDDTAGNRRRTAIDYGSYLSWGLPWKVTEYAADATTPVRVKFTDYNLSQAYIDLRIIGLVSSVVVTNYYSNQSRITYAYDEPGRLSAGPANTFLHDSNYNTSWTTRGNLTSVSQWDVTDINNPAKAHTTGMAYNTNGLMVWSQDALGHQTSLDYSENYSDSQNNRNAYAYPTRITDPDGFSSGVLYVYDTGSIRIKQDAKLNALIYEYDSIGRLSRVYTWDPVNSILYGATRYAYGPDYQQSWTTVQSGQPEAYAVTYFDGAGRVRANSEDFPGSTGGYRSVYNMWNNMGRLALRSNPTEINSAGTPVGDDAAGWTWTSFSYDWMGRLTQTTNPDGSTTGATYTACGCAGGDSVTTRDERGRQRVLKKDTLGRLVEVQELNFNGTLYAKTTYAYNALDQITTIHQDGISDRTFSYDGYARLSSKMTPEQGTTTYAYNNDDTVQAVTDARGAAQTFTYNNRHLPTAITYGVPAGVAATPNVSFAYDQVGNRTQMNDGQGATYYQYNVISQLTDEMRVFNGITGPSSMLVNNSTVGGGYKLSYQYNLQGDVTKITNPASIYVSYARNAAGDITGVSGNYGGAVTYASNIKGRAFGAVKQISYGNGRALTATYDNRMRVATWGVDQLLLRWQYNYDYFGEKSGRATYIKNLDDGTLDRSYDYDDVGRLRSSYTGESARAHVGIAGATWVGDGPYAHAYAYDVYGNLTNRYGWGGWNPSDTVSFTNNRRNGPTYDAAGNMTYDGGQYSYDANERQSFSDYRTLPGWNGYTLSQYYDGDAQRVKKDDNGEVRYFLRSSVLGGAVVSEMASNGGWLRGYVYLGSQMLAIQYAGVHWVHEAPVVKSQRFTASNGGPESSLEMDEWGGETNRSDNQSSLTSYQPHRFATYERDGNSNDYAMARTYHAWLSRFDQPDPSDGSYNLSDPQSFNRYAYVGNDPVNFTDPSGLLPCIGAECGYGGFGGWGGGWGGRDLSFSEIGITGREIITQAERDYDWRMRESLIAPPGGQIGIPIVPDVPSPFGPARMPNIADQIGQPPPSTPIHCQPDVIDAMKRAWSRTGNGTLGTEAGFVLNGTPSNYNIVDTKSANTQSSQKITVYGNTFLLFHVHPNSSTRNPSTPDNNSRGDRNSGDTLVSDIFQQRGRTIPFLVGHKNGLTMYDPRTKQVTVLRENLDWTKPCK